MSKDGLILGIGNRFRRDDGLGPLAVQALQQRSWPIPAPDFACCSGEGTQLMAAWQGYQWVLLIDAIAAGRSDHAAGQLLCWDALTETIPQELFHYSSHAFGLAEAVEMARALGELPPQLWIYGLSGADFGAGEGLSEAVSAALPLLLDAVCQRIRQQP
ncbi:MAG: hydrogenase maturation protease [Candidatus Sericytochromatia bacterium]|nr:hydrogenase maturation protease [Candidatus Sericytochromatia bacterium]